MKIVACSGCRLKRCVFSIMNRLFSLHRKVCEDSGVQWVSLEALCFLYYECSVLSPPGKCVNIVACSGCHLKRCVFSINMNPLFSLHQESV